jgi:hypothetical protein
MLQSVSFPITSNFWVPCLSRYLKIFDLQRGAVLVLTITSRWSPPSSRMSLQTRRPSCSEDRRPDHRCSFSRRWSTQSMSQFCHQEKLECRIVEQHLCPRERERDGLSNCAFPGWRTSWSCVCLFVSCPVVWVFFWVGRGWEMCWGW